MRIKLGDALISCPRLLVLIVKFGSARAGGFGIPLARPFT